MNFALILSLAILFDILLGDSIKYFPHPVILIGNVINFLEKRIYNKNFINGIFICLITLFLAGFSAGIFLLIFSRFLFLAQVYLLYSAIAWRDLKDETLKIFEFLFKKDLFSARKYLSRVVGRDTENLSENEISKAVIETIAENSVDGIFSVIFYAAIGYMINKNFGTGIFVWLFKASSTLDSMIGYEENKKFGMPSAKLDDILNFVPARIGGFIIVFSGLIQGYNFKRALRIFLRDRKKHKSPNSAHGESAFSGVLNLKLGGGAFYKGIFEKRELIGEGKNPEAFDIIRAYKLLDVSVSLFSIFIILMVYLWEKF